MDELTALESDLEIGMVVTVSGEISADGMTGVASTVSHDDSAEGPVFAIKAIGNDGTMLELDIFGQVFLVERGLTVFDEDDAAFTFDTLAVNDVVEVSGFMNDLGVLVASHIENKGLLSLGTTPVEIKGIVANFDNVNTFEIDSMLITFDAAGITTDLSDLPGGVANGLYVEVEGVIESATAITASEIEIEDSGLDHDATDVQIEGFVANFVDAGNFTVSSQMVDASTATLVPSNPSALTDGAEVNIHGSMVNGILIADRIEFRGNQLRIAAEIAAGFDIDAVNDSLHLLGVAVSVNSATRFDDKLLDLLRFGLGDLTAGDFIEIRGYSDGNGGVVATRLERMSVADEVSVQGPVEAFDGTTGTVTILGLTLVSDVATSWEDANDLPLTQAEFFAAVQLDQLVKVDGDSDAIDKRVMGVAEEVEFED
jgi:hypothetical protein